MTSWKKKRKIMKLYDATAHIYDSWYAEEQTAKIIAALKHVKIDKTSFALDVGCGTGTLFDHIADKAREVIGVDISKKSLIEAAKRAKLFKNVHLVQSDADNMPFSKVFTHVFAITLLQNEPNPPATLRELQSTAEDDAVIVVTGLKKLYEREEFEKLLLNTGMKVKLLEDEDNLKCHIALCSGHAQ